MAALHVRAWQAAYRGILSDAFLDALRVEEWARRRRGHLESPASPETRAWVLDGPAGIGGFAVTGPTRDVDVPGATELYAIYVEPSAVGTGRGRALWQHVRADLDARGVTTVTLWVFEANARARRFYESAGFRTDGATKTVAFGDRAPTEVRYRRSSDSPR